MTAEACLFAASSCTRRRRQLLRGMLWRLVPGATVHRGQCVPQTLCLLAPADDRNAPATTAGGIGRVCICTLKPILAATPRPATVNGAPLSETNAKAALAPAAPAIHPLAVGKLDRVIICREFSDVDQIIKFEHGGDGSAAENRTTGRISEAPMSFEPDS